ncbi:hypothetical protein [Saccharopolyspora sp. NPDC002686]|uniref:hypothetical protein n=1 Tax=Saccharopolyspora sp. NPDC002686 TaxID=3154541 RepID=UPI0033289A5C
MTEPTGQPEPIKGDNTSSATFDQVLFTVTGEGADLHGIVDSGADQAQGWFQESSVKPGSAQTDGQSAGSGYSYHAWDKWYLSVDRNPTLPGNWDKALAEIDALTDQLKAANIGLMNVNRLRDAKESVDHYVEWLSTNHDTLQQWANKLSSDDSAFKGKAAHAIQQSVNSLAETVESLREQIVEERNTSEGLQRAAEAASNFGKGMATAWSEYSGALKNLATNTMNAVLNNVSAYVYGKGLVHGTPNYALDVLARSSRDKAETYIQNVMDGYRSDDNRGPAVTQPSVQGAPGMMWPVITPGSVNADSVPFTPGKLPEGFPVIGGPLGSQTTWNDINAKISDYMRKKMEPLDEAARKRIDELRTGYENTKSSLEGLETPISQTGGGPGGGPGGNFPPPNGGINIPPPNGGGDLNVPPPNGGGDLNGPPGNGGGDLNLPPANGGGDLNGPPGNGGGDLNLPPASGGGGVNDPANGGGNTPSTFGGGDLPPANGGSNLPGGGDAPAFGGGDNPALGGGGLGDQPPGGIGDVPPANGGGGAPIVPPNGMTGPFGGGSANSPDAKRQLNEVPGGGNPFDPANGAANSLGGNFDPAGGASNLPGGSFDPAGGSANLPGGGELPGGNFDPAGGTSNLPGGGSNLPGGGSDLPGGSFDPAGGSANLPGGSFDPAGGSANLPGGSFDPAGGSANLPGGSDLPGGGFDPAGGTSNLPGGGELPGGGFDPAGGSANLPGGSDLPGGGFDPAGGTSNLPGGGELPGGSFDPAGGTSNLPGGASLPGGGFDPAGGTSNLPGGSGLSGGSFDPAGGTSSLPGGGGDFSGLPGGGAGGSTGGFGGEGWSDWSGQDQTTQQGGPSQVGGSVGDPRGGMPMMPPMMPPMSGGQNNAKERERQTWLSEDENVWGTSSAAGNGVIGLPNDLAHETDEPLAPTHVHVSSTAPRTSTDAPKQSEQPAEQSATS